MDGEGYYGRKEAEKGHSCSRGVGWLLSPIQLPLVTSGIKPDFNEVKTSVPQFALIEFQMLIGHHVGQC